MYLEVDITFTVKDDMTYLIMCANIISVSAVSNLKRFGKLVWASSIFNKVIHQNVLGPLVLWPQASHTVSMHLLLHD